MHCFLKGNFDNNGISLTTRTAYGEEKKIMILIFEHSNASLFFSQPIPDVSLVQIKSSMTKKIAVTYFFRDESDDGSLLIRWSIWDNFWITARNFKFSLLSQ